MRATISCGCCALLLAAAGSDVIWTAEVCGGGRGLAVITDVSNADDDVADEFGERTTDAEGGQVLASAER